MPAVLSRCLRLVYLECCPTLPLAMTFLVPFGRRGPSIRETAPAIGVSASFKVISAVPPFPMSSTVVATPSVPLLGAAFVPLVPGEVVPATPRITTRPRLGVVRSPCLWARAAEPTEGECSCVPRGGRGLLLVITETVRGEKSFEFLVGSVPQSCVELRGAAAPACRRKRRRW